VYLWKRGGIAHGYWEQFTAPEDHATFLMLLLLVGSPARLFSACLFYSRERFAIQKWTGSSKKKHLPRIVA
jgi:hypothetical protein